MTIKGALAAGTIIGTIMGFAYTTGCDLRRRARDPLIGPSQTPEPRKLIMHIHGADDPVDIFVYHLALDVFCDFYRLSTQECIALGSGIDLHLVDEIPDPSGRRLWGLHTYLRDGSSRIIVKKRGGPGEDSFLHEVLHRWLLRSTGSAFFPGGHPGGIHSERFAAEVKALKKHWKKVVELD